MKILLISYYFPPCGGAPVQRWLRFIPPLVARGHQITVITSKNGDYPFEDPQLCEKIPPAVKVIRVPALGMTRIWKLLSGKNSQMPYGSIPQQAGLVSKILIWLRLNLIIPDLRVFWNPAAYRAALRELRVAPYDTLITTGPPHSSHLLGLKLSRTLRIKWCADFRDPFSQIHYLQLSPPSKTTLAIHRYMERKILAQSDLCTVVSAAIADALPEGSKIVIHNGYNPQDFVALKHRPAGYFRIKYVGQLTAGQNVGLISAFCSLMTRDYTLSLIGTQLGEKQRAELESACAERLRIAAFKPHKGALEEMVNSDLLLLIINDYEGNSGVLTTKLFEYLAARTPILCFCPADSAAAQVIRECKAGNSFAYGQIPEAVKWAESLKSSQRTDGDILSYSIDHQIDILENALLKQNSD